MDVLFNLLDPDSDGEWFSERKISKGLNPSKSELRPKYAKYDLKPLRIPTFHPSKGKLLLSFKEDIFILPKKKVNQNE